MVQYSMSPGAYDGLLRLAKDPHWCPDFARILRYLDVAVSMKEAVLVGAVTGSLPAERKNWTTIAFVEAVVTVPSRAAKK